MSTELNALNIAAIRQLLRMGFRQTEVASIFRVSQTHIGKIHRREKWRQIG